MSEELTIDRIRELRAGITKPPWAIEWDLTTLHIWAREAELGDLGNKLRPIADVHPWRGYTDTEEANHNADFIAAAPEAIDYLLAKLNEMRADTERMNYIETYGFSWMPRRLDYQEPLREILDRAALAQHHGTQREKQ